MEFSNVVKMRKSKRWYTDREVPKETIKNILKEASLAPSFMNGQPWEVAIVTGDKLREIAELYEKMLTEKKDTHSLSWEINWPKRQKAILNSMKEVKVNRVYPADPYGKWIYYAPVGIFIHIHRSLNEWALFDIGLFVQTLLLSATNNGLQTVPQARMGNNNREVAELLGLGEERRIIMGVCMGYADMDHPNNSFLSPRVDPEEFTSWHS